MSISLTTRSFRGMRRTINEWLHQYVTYTHNQRGKFIYSFTTCDVEGCAHYDGVRARGNIYNGWMPIAKVDVIYYDPAK